MACRLLDCPLDEHLAFQSADRGRLSGGFMLSTCALTIEWFVPLGQTRLLTMALHTLAADTRSTRGCIGCSVTTDIGNRGTVRYTEEWLTDEDLRRHVRSDIFGQLVTLIDNATEPPRIEFKLVHETRGLDFVEEVRSSSAT
jgi:quinol monooxygenase YgiN